MPQTQAQRRAKAKYNAKAYDLKGNKDIIKAYCNDKNTSLNALINSLLTERLTADGYTMITKEDTI